MPKQNDSFKLTSQQEEAFDHYLSLYEMSLSDHVSPDGRTWLDQEMKEMDRDMISSKLVVPMEEVMEVV